MTKISAIKVLQKKGGFIKNPFLQTGGDNPRFE